MDGGRGDCDDGGVGGVVLQENESRKKRRVK